MTQTAKQETQKKELPPVSFDEFEAPDYETWKQEAIVTLKGASFEKKLLTKTYEGITLEPIYTMEMAPKPEDLSNLPGMENYMRGVKPGGYMEEPWKIAQQSDEIIPEKLNQLISHELKKGATAINIALDAATRHGRNAASLTDEEIQAGGVSFTTMQDLHEALLDIDLKKYEIYMPCGASAALMVGMFGAARKADGCAKADVHGMIGANPLGTLAAEGCLPFSLDALYDEMAHTTRWAEKNMPQLRTILVDGAVYSNGGASAVQELGYVLAAGISYIRALQVRGLKIDVIAERMQFAFSLGSNFFMEIAKLRAARMLWSQVVEKFGGGAEARKMRIHARTAKVNKTVYDPYVNMLRTTTEAFSGVVGGVDSLQVAPFDESIRGADTFSRRIARNTQLILQNECNLRQPVDPAGGSWYIESLTHQLAERAWAVMQQVESEGGLAASLKKGVVQADIADVLAQRFKKAAQRAESVVGINMYANALEIPLETRPADTEAIRKIRAAMVNGFMEDVDMKHRDEQLAKIADAAGSEPGVLIDALATVFAAGATIGDAAGAMRIDEETEAIASAIVPHRVAEQFEALRVKMAKYEQKHGEKLKIFLCNMGKIPQHKPRAEFSTGFFEVGGFEIIKNDGFMTPEEAVAAAVESGAFAAVICSTDATYPELVPPVAKGIKAKKPAMLVLVAGAPAPEFEASYREAGVEEFIHVRANCLKIMSWLQTKGGIQ